MFKRMVSGTLFAALVGFCSFAHSDTLPAMAGHIWCPLGTAPSTCNADTFCFQSGWAQNTNKCTATKKLIVPVQTRTTGTTQFSVVATGTPGFCTNAVACRAIVNTNNNGFVAQTTSSVAVCGANVLGSLAVGTGNTVHYDCDFPPGASLTSFEFH